jgi:hypothetical protein
MDYMRALLVRVFQSVAHLRELLCVELLHAIQRTVCPFGNGGEYMRVDQIS